MIGHWDRVVLVIAELIAVGLIIVFSGRFVLQADKRSGLFKTALALFVLLYGGAGIGCTSRNTVGGENAVGATSHTAAPQSDDESIVALSTAPTKTADVSIPDSLAIDDRWPRFKALWQKLDRVEPKQRNDNTDLERSFGGPYANALTAQEQDVYRAELASIVGLSVPDLARIDWHPVGAAKNGGGAFDPLTAILARLSLGRIDRMGVPHELMSRMRPPPSARYGRQVVGTLESRIDSLLNLSKRADVEPELVSAALEKIQNDVYLSAVIELTGHYRYGYMSPAPVAPPSEKQTKTPQKSQVSSGIASEYWSEPSAWARGLEQAHKRNLENAKSSKSSMNVDDINRIYRAVREKLAELERLEPQLDALVAELER